jgi:hypothetical protein
VISHAAVLRQGMMLVRLARRPITLLATDPSATAAVLLEPLL